MTNRQIFINIAQDLDLSTVAPFDFYRTIFAKGELEKKGIQEPGRYNAMIQLPGERFIYLHDELDSIPDYMTVGDAWMNCITYAGQTGVDSLAREIHAWVFRVNFPHNTDWHSFVAFCSRHKHKQRYMPSTRIAPTYVTTSGKANEVLFYYVMEEPIPMYKKFIEKIKSMHTYLAREIHMGLRSVSYETVSIPRQASIYAKYPVVGTIANGDIVTAYHTGDTYTLNDINALLPKAKRLSYHKSSASLDEAKELWPDWHKRKVVQKRKASGKKTWDNKKDLFDWYVKQVQEHADIVKPGVFEALMAYAVKAAIPPNQLSDTMKQFQILFQNRFSQAVIDEHSSRAWNKYEVDSKKLKYWSITYIEKLTGLELPRNKRNGRTQKQHLAMVHKAQSKKENVRRWRKKHPDGTRTECAKALRITWDTANRWWETEYKSVNESKLVPDSQTKRLICEEKGCGGSLNLIGTFEWYSEAYGNFYKQKRWKCEKCNAIVHGKARVKN